MKVLKVLFPVSLLVLLTVFIISSFAVYGSWIYYQNAEDYYYQTLGSVVDFGYAPEEVVPGGDNTAELGQNHLNVINLILWEDDKGYGLNINDNVLIHQYLKDKKVVYSNQKISGGNLKHILDPSNNTHGLYYCIEKVDATTYYCYTYDIESLVNAEGTDNEIDVYRTTLEKGDKWVATKSYLGHARVVTLGSLGLSADPKCENVTISVESWHMAHTN